MTMEIIDITFQESDTTRDKLIKAMQALIAVYGYDATSTRMIANLAKVNLSAIGFHFGSKENLAYEAVKSAAEVLEKHYRKLSDEINEFLTQRPVDKERAWQYIDRLLSVRMRRAFNNNKSWINIGLAKNESGLPENTRGLMAQTAVVYNEKVLADLILAVSDRADPFRAAMISRSIHAMIASYMEKPIINQITSEVMGVDFLDAQRMEDELHAYFMKSIKASTQIG